MSTEGVSGFSSANSTESASSEVTTTSSKTSTDYSNVTVSSISQLKEEYPELYNNILEFLAMQMNSQSRKDQQRLKETMREGRQNS